MCRNVVVLGLTASLRNARSASSLAQGHVRALTWSECDGVGSIGMSQLVATDARNLSLAFTVDGAAADLSFR